MTDKASSTLIIGYSECLGFLKMSSNDTADFSFWPKIHFGLIFLSKFTINKTYTREHE